MITGTGPGRAKLMFVAGYPSFFTDKERSPYAGETGHLLTRIIAAMKLTPDDVFFSHVVKCRPPEGRQPSTGDMQRCLPFLEQEISTVAPQVICALGEYAARALLGGNEPLEKRRGRFYESNGLAVMITWHPEDILDDPSRRRPVWEDIQKVMARLNLPSAGQP
jgi:DNA polymerase